MCCFTRRKESPFFGREGYREVEKEPNRIFEHDQAFVESESGFGNKVLHFFKSARVTAVMNRMVSTSKTLLSRLASNETDENTPAHSVEKGTKSYIPATETVTFPLYVAPTPNLPVSQSLTSASTTDLVLHFNNIPPVIENDLSRVNKDECSELDDFRYKERKLSKMSFPEIEKGIVCVRARWLEPFLSGKKADKNNYSLSVKGMKLRSSGNIADAESPVLRVHGLREQEITVGQLFLGFEPDIGSELDDSPRSYKHRMPEDEPKLRVEPGTVARGALRLELILTGRERQASIPKEEEQPLSPTRVAQGRFVN